ncbi:spindle assembly abnormal protein 6 homolog [Condylostylus longicornis]|uniref:spindle assembly abnormal protein 6 homolog n=1 Tax=Condylostylus longicornis TaxID=2530218 RepID=UPI00244E205A|nr:spindle assembly abnormal protein 6 homolog [Condylostylus longicornis]
MFFNSIENGAEAFIRNPQEKIETIFHPYEFEINFKLDQIVVPKTCCILAEKISDKELIQIRIAEKNERKMYTSTINTQFFNILKTNQSLHVTFLGFIDNLLKILQGCQNKTLQISIVRRDKENEILLQFYEVHAFKNLTHLSLPIEEASLNVVNYHLNKIIDKLQKQTVHYETTILGLQTALRNCNENFLEIKKENQTLKEEILEQKHLYTKKQRAGFDEMHNKIKSITEAKKSDENEYKKIISQLQAKIDFITLEKANILKEKSEEIRKCDNLRKEISQIKIGNSNLKKSNEHLIKQLDLKKSGDCRYNEQVNDLQKKNSEYEKKISNLEKVLSELKAELQAEKKLCQVKRNALEVASDEITKANDIISKQAVEIVKLKKTIDWRTEVALQQELTIKKKEKALSNINNNILALEEELKKIRSETSNLPIDITSIKQSVESIEKKYKNKILELKAATKT